MSITRFSLLTIAGALMAAPAVLAAGSPARGPDDASRVVRSRHAERDSLRVAAALAAAERYAVAGRSAEARRQYRNAIAEQSADGACTAGTYWSLAATYYGDGDELAAARALDDAAASAADCADPEMELRATFEAAVLFAQHGRRDLIGARVSRIKRLLRSPAIPADVKTAYQRRLSEK